MKVSMNKKRRRSLFLAAGLLLQALCAPFVPLSHAVKADESVFTVSNADDFAALAALCTLDTRSELLTVELMDDIDFSGKAFTPIPTFGGVFHGNGHTLSGIFLDAKGSYQGVFRYVRKGAVINDLHVTGSFRPGGSKSYIGSIVGENAGTLESCSFSGGVHGENVIGGLVGHNTESGVILSCTVYGSVSGENTTGGIVGKNSGCIRDCINYAAVNTVYEEKKNDLTSMGVETDTGALLESYKAEKEESAEESALGHTDTGGIAGYSSGILQGCVNHAAIGYAHIGYNVGGIVGRQTGYLLGCRNDGSVRGRKDVGGIVGQAEPYIVLHATESDLKDIQKELDGLNESINDFIASTDGLSSDARTHLDALSDHATEAKEHTQGMLDAGTDFVDDNLDKINAEAAVFSNALDKLEPVLEDMEQASGSLTEAFDGLEVTLSEFELEAPDLREELETITGAVGTISLAETSVKKAVGEVKEAMEELDDALRFKNTKEARRALNKLSAAIKDIIRSKQTIKDANETIRDTILSKPESFEALGINVTTIIEELKNVGGALKDILASLKELDENLDAVLLNTEIDLSHCRKAASKCTTSLENLASAMGYISDGLEEAADGARLFSDALYDYTETVSDELSTFKDGLSEALDSTASASENLKAAFSDMKEVLSELNDDEPFEFETLGDGFREQSDGLFESLSDISDDIERLKDALSTDVDGMSEKLSTVSDRFHSLFTLLIDKIESIENADHSLSDVFTDVSDENIESAREGKIADSRNFGTVEADRNTGGIVGAMAIEYAKDPEDEMEKPTTLNFTYRTRAVLQECVNDGEVIGKKDCVGGIVGLAELGTIYKCESYADTESTDGSYVGGIVGKSEAAVRKSYAKCHVSGKRYVGGLAGKGKTLSAGYSLATVSGEENVGAVCGDVSALGELNRNYYVDVGIGAVDGISYKDKAEPIAYENLKSIAEIPERFTGFTVTFVADGVTVDVQSALYGQELSDVRVPPIPEKEGCFGSWQMPSVERITENLTVICDYKPYITVLSCVERTANGKLALALVEGAFTDRAVLHVTPSEKEPIDDGTAYDLTLADSSFTENDRVTVHFVNPDKTAVKLWQWLDGAWEPLQVTARGKYVIAEVLGTESTICIQYGNGSPALRQIGGAAVLISIGAAICIVRHRKKKKKAKKK